MYPLHGLTLEVNISDEGKGIEPKTRAGRGAGGSE